MIGMIGNENKKIQLIKYHEENPNIKTQVTKIKIFP
jgi:hypothetical protein